MSTLKPSRRRVWLFVGLAAGAILALLACVAVAAFLIFGGESPGEGAKAERGYEVAQPIIAALEVYHAQQGAYPDDLTDLVPDYLADLPAEVNGYPIEYRLTDASYSLEFSYTGPGMNHCSYTPETDWRCYGYY